MPSSQQCPKVSKLLTHTRFKKKTYLTHITFNDRRITRELYDPGQTDAMIDAIKLGLLQKLKADFYWKRRKRGSSCGHRRFY